MRAEQVGTVVAPMTPRTCCVLADALRPLARRVSEGDGGPALEELVRLAVAHVPGAGSASLTVRRGSRLTTEAATDETARRADRLQLEPGAAPARMPRSTTRVRHRRRRVDRRWPRWGRAVHDELGVASVLWQRLTLLGEPEAVAALTIYSDAARRVRRAGGRHGPGAREPRRHCSSPRPSPGAGRRTCCGRWRATARSAWPWAS